MKSGCKTGLIVLVLLGSIFSITPLQVSAIGEGWLSGWDYRQQMNITGSVGAGTNYQIFVNVTYHYDSNMQPDFDDLRFTDDDGITLLDYWLEDYTASEFAYVWIEVSDNLNEDQVIFMYYGNDAVSTTSNGDNTFIFFDDFEYSGYPNASKWVQEGSENDITCNGHDLVLTGTGGTQEGYGGLWGSDTVNTTLHYRGNSTSTNTLGHEYGMFDIDHLGDNNYECIYIYGNVNPYTGTLYTRNNGNPASDSGNAPYPKTEDHVWSYNWFENSTSRYVDVYQGDSLAYNQSGVSIPDGDTEIVPYFGNGINTYYVHYVFVAKYVVSEPTADFQKEWVQADVVNFILDVDWTDEFQFGYDAFFIFLGLIMIPASTMYLVRGGRDEMNTDKLFFSLIVFFIGIALVIGGIMP